MAGLPAPGFDQGKVLPWGRNRSEYQAFFALGGLGPGSRLLDCGAGPSSFTVEMARRGHGAVAADPLYQLAPGALAGRIADARRVMTAAVRAACGRFVWDAYGSPEALEEVRLSAMAAFLEDFEEAPRDGCYVAAALPDLPFADASFDLALSSHFLLLYASQLDDAFHLAAVREMLRVAREARIFPLLDLEGAVSKRLDPLRRGLDAAGAGSEIVTVGYEFQKGGNQMLRIAAR